MSALPPALATPRTFEAARHSSDPETRRTSAGDTVADVDRALAREREMSDVRKRLRVLATFPKPAREDEDESQDENEDADADGPRPQATPRRLRSPVALAAVEVDDVAKFAAIGRLDMRGKREVLRSMAESLDRQEGRSW